MKKIERLTSNQEADLIEFRQRMWLQGTSTVPMDRAVAEKAITEAYAIVNTRIGIAGSDWRLEGWVNNVFDKDYVPIAFAYQLAPSGYVGENGAPRTVGVSVSRTF